MRRAAGEAGEALNAKDKQWGASLHPDARLRGHGASMCQTQVATSPEPSLQLCGSSRLCRARLLPLQSAGNVARWGRRRMTAAEVRQHRKPAQGICGRAGRSQTEGQARGRGKADA